MTTTSRDVSVTLEGEVYVGEQSAPLRLRVSQTLVPEEGKAVSDEEVTRAAAALKRTLLVTLKTLGSEESELRPSVTYSGPTRSIEVLREIYTPRSPDHVDALLWEGEISREEHGLLLGTLRTRGETVAPAPAHLPRPVPVLIEELKLQDMRDVNRARGKRVISYDEWLALKQHFARVGAPSA